MFNAEEKMILKELVEIEIAFLKTSIKESYGLDKQELQKYLEKIENIHKKIV